MFWPFKKRGIYLAPDRSRFSPAKPATIGGLKKAEKDLGFALPDRLVKLYMEVGNGGFGPDYGVIGIEGGHLDNKRNIVSLYNMFVEDHSSDDEVDWPKGLLPICHHGCGTYSCINCLEAGFPVYTWTCDEFSDGATDVPFEGLELRLSYATLDSWISNMKRIVVPN